MPMKSADEGRDASPSSSGDGGGLPWRVGLLVLFALAGLAALVFLPLRAWLLAALDALAALGMWALPAYGLLYVLATVLFLPGSLVTMAGGFLFGPLWGTLVVSLASTVGVASAFLLGRTVARPWVLRLASKHRRFPALDRAVAASGFKIVLLTRLSPIFPFNLLNYAFGVTSVRFRHYVLASWLGMLPATFFFVSLGSTARDLAQIASGKAGGGSGSLPLLLIGALATFLVTLLLARIAAKALRGVTDER